MRNRAGSGSMPCVAVQEISDPGDIKDLVPDCDADPRFGGAVTTERRIGQILNGKVGSRHIGAGDETFQRRIVGVVDVSHQAARPIRPRWVKPNPASYLRP